MIINTGNYSSKSRKIILILWLAVLLLIEVLAIYNLTLKRMISFKNYKINSENYILLNAKIKEKKERIILYENILIFKIPMVKIEYQINKNTFCEWINYNFDCSQNDIIEVAVKKDNYSTIIPVIPHYLSKYEKSLYFKFFLVNIVVFLVIYIFFQREKKKKIESDKEYYKQSRIKTRYEEVREFNTIDKMKKKEMLIGIICKNMSLKDTILINDIKKLYREENIKLNLESIWYLDIIESYKAYSSLLYLSIINDNSVLSIDITTDLWGQGLPREYYVIDVADNNYYCCKEDSERVYVYSRSIGITNTQYPDLFDYILAKLKREDERIDNLQL